MVFLKSNFLKKKNWKSFKRKKKLWNGAWKKEKELLKEKMEWVKQNCFFEKKGNNFEKKKKIGDKKLKAFKKKKKKIGWRSFQKSFGNKKLRKSWKSKREEIEKTLKKELEILLKNNWEEEILKRKMLEEFWINFFFFLKMLCYYYYFFKNVFKEMFACFSWKGLQVWIQMRNKFKMCKNVIGLKQLEEHLSWKG